MPPSPSYGSKIPSQILLYAGRFWFVAAMIGQYCFGAYIIVVYGISAVSSDFEKWNNRLYSGVIPGEWLGNFLLVFHITLASIILFGGPLQFIPLIRNKFRKFHRWLGKTYLILSVAISVGGLVMTIMGKSFGTPFMQVTNSFSVIYIVSFAWLAFKHARKRNISVHQQWALRLFMMTNGVWFFRVWSQAWHITSPVSTGNYTDTFSKEHVLSVLTYVLPISLILLEFYFNAIKKEEPRLQLAASVTLFVFTFIMIVGIYGTVNNMWLPSILKALN